MASEPIYRITFHNQGHVYEIYARHVFQSDLWGFLEVEEFIFGERSQMIVDPAEEKLKNEFSGIKLNSICGTLKSATLAALPSSVLIFAASRVPETKPSILKLKP